MADDVVVDLALAQDEPLDPLAIGARVVDYRLELAASEILERRARLLEPQEAFRSHDDERPRGRVERLSPQQVEVLRRRRAVRDPQVLLRRKLQEALEAGARVLGAVALVAVRQEERESGRFPPLRKPGGDELVDDDLRSVDEVAELGLPEDEHLG